jgi:hypothetical protein
LNYYRCVYISTQVKLKGVVVHKLSSVEDVE